ncbi:unnamed protein product [Acidithrix sp. C25]|nr:unnamed protein product [Acidithrix sp. C25]
MRRQDRHLLWPSKCDFEESYQSRSFVVFRICSLAMLLLKR